MLSVVSALSMLRSAQTTSPQALEVAPGYRAEVVAAGFTYPTSLAIAPDGMLYVAEAGYSYGPKTAVARILALPPGTREAVVPPAEAADRGGVGHLYVSHRGRITVLTLAPSPQGAPSVVSRSDLLTGLPSLGDHQNNDLVFGPDGFLYMGQGTATNAGVVGSDNFVHAWEPPLAEFGPHSSPMKLAVSPGGPFGDAGALYVALFGDGEPLTQNLPTPLGTQVVRVDPATGEYRTFLKNRGQQPRAGRYGPGLKRCVAVAFDPSGTALYVLDFGELETTDLAPNAIPRTGVLWRIVPESSQAGEEGAAGAAPRESLKPAASSTGR